MNRRLVSLAVSFAILAFLWWRVDLASIGRAAAHANRSWLIAGLLMVVPLTLGTAARFRMLAGSGLPLRIATRLILSSSTLNLILPSKLGDLAKAWVLERRHGYAPGVAVSLVVLEKALDLASLLVWGLAAILWIGGSRPELILGGFAIAGLLGLLLLMLTPLPVLPLLMRCFRALLPPRIGGAVAAFERRWTEMIVTFWSEPAVAVRVLSASLAIWAGHLLQIWLFARALGEVPFLASCAFATLSILAGLLPFTMAGIGTRDAAIIYFFGSALGTGSAALLGVLATMRYLIPAVAGVPFMRDYWHKAEPA